MAEDKQLSGIRKVVIAGTGSYLPEQILTNHDLAKIVDTTDEWIQTRTGIRERRRAADGEVTSELAAHASRRALEAAGVTPEEVQLIVVATITPDMMFPSTSCIVQDRIGATNAFCFDLEAACSGFQYALDVAQRYIATGDVEIALVIGAEKLSTFLDWNDRATCVLFGDGAGAAVLRPADDGQRGFIGSVMGSDGSLAGLLGIPGGGTALPPSIESLQRGDHFLKMEGREVFKQAVRCMSDAAGRVLEKCGLTIADVKWIIPHQANMRIMTAIAERLDVPIERFYLNVHRYGNMSAASVPVALDEAARDGSLESGDLVLFVVFGGGFTWGATVLEW
ncbi:MAG: ketoacyl-ACP synthase III [Verrucomicrobia bacterium]|nr:ketoacyl-ACP synthase III [Verrucomicrobiota bacterium]MDA1086724.1 ketoacyl-ACP synthase III [Verrucomicrobiota bacterium]